MKCSATQIIAFPRLMIPNPALLDTLVSNAQAISVYIVILNNNETLFFRKTSICSPLQQKCLSQSKLK